MPSPASDSLFARALQLMPGGVNSPVRAFRSVGGAPFFTKAARGATLVTADGRELIDFVCTWGPAIHGHNHPAIRAAIAAALEQGTSFGTPNPREVEMAELITRFVPSIQKVRLCNSGTEATMSAIRLARGFTKRDLIIKFAGCYHGHSDSLLIKAGSGALTHGNPDSAGVPAAFARETMVLPYNDLPAVEAAFAAQRGKVAAVIVEPMTGSGGVFASPTNYLKRLREICDRHGILLIFDEVITAFGRLGAGFAAERLGVIPDMITCAKGLTNGAVPMGAVLVRKGIHDALMRGPENTIELFHGYAYSGHPLAAAAGLATLDLYAGEGLYARAAALEAHWEAGVHSLRGLPHVVDLRNLGLIAGIELESRAGTPTTRGYDVFLDCFEQGLLVRVTGDIVALSPPLIVSSNQIDEIFTIVGRSIRRVA